eukprot:490336-Pyramimonas_sp.AAC.1
MIHAGFGIESPIHLRFGLTNECRDRLLEGALLGGRGRFRELLQRWVGDGLTEAAFLDSGAVLQLPFPVSIL